MEPRSPALQADSLPAEPPRKPKNTGVGSLPLLQGIFPTQKWNRGLLHGRRILYQLSSEGSPFHVLGQCKSNCSFALLKFIIWYWNTFLNKCGYVIHHFNAHFFFALSFSNDLLLAAHLIFILDYGNVVRQKTNLSDFLIRFQNGS